MALEDLANVVISQEGPALTQVGFGTLGLACFHTHTPNMTDTYASLSAAVADGFLTHEPAYRMLARAFAQNPRPTNAKILRLKTPWTQHVKLTPVSAVNSTVYAYTCNYLGVEYDLSYTSDSSATIAEIVAGLAAAFEAAASPLATAAAATAGGGGTFTDIVNGTPGAIIYYSNWTDNLKFQDLTADPGIQADLAAIRDVDGDWYGLGLDINSTAIIEAADTFAETLPMMLGTSNCDSIDFDPAVSTDVGSVLKAGSAGRVIGVYANKDTANYGGVAALAERFPHDPGSQGAGGTFFGKTLVGVLPGNWSATQIAALRAKNYIVLITTAGRVHTLDGKVFGGEFADVVRGLDWYRIRSEERVAALLLNNDKVPFTDRGITQVYSELRAQQIDAENVELFVPGSSTLTVPRRADVPSGDRAARKLTGIGGTAILAGAIHLVDPINISIGT